MSDHCLEPILFIGRLKQDVTNKKVINLAPLRNVNVPLNIGLSYTHANGIVIYKIIQALMKLGAECQDHSDISRILTRCTVTRD